MPSAEPTDAELLARARAWAAQDPDPHTRATVAQWVLARDMPPIRQAFGSRLRFGTAGLRAFVGPGPNAINNLLVRQTCSGLLETLLALVPEAQERGVAVGFDGRHHSRAFAEAAVGVCLAAGFRVHFFEREVPTPLVGFWVKTERLAAGVVVTASHNPPAYNGIKVYWHDGAQISPPHDRTIASRIDDVAARAKPPACLHPADYNNHPKLEWVANVAQQAYLQALRAHLPQPPDPLQQHASTSASPAVMGRLSVAYTPLHGVGAHLAKRAVAPLGHVDWHVVAAQAEPDGDFPTVAFPNPEEPGSMDAVLALAQAQGCHLACAHDPDADRLAVAARDAQGALRLLTGDELGILLASHLLAAPAPNDVVATTKASSRLLGVFARALGVGYVETLTGFKWLAQAGLAAETQHQRLVFAYEEAMGYAVTRLVWDKDGVSALVALCQLARALQLQNRTLWDGLDQLQATYGIYVSAQQTLALDAAKGTAFMQDVRARLAAHTLPRLGDWMLLAHDDLLQPDGGAEQLPPSDVVLLFYGADGQRTEQARTHGLRIILRPSGTEPKLKIYYELAAAPTGLDLKEVPQRRLQLQQSLAGIQALHRQQLLSYAAGARA